MADNAPRTGYNLRSRASVAQTAAAPPGIPVPQNAGEYPQSASVVSISAAVPGGFPHGITPSPSTPVGEPLDSSRETMPPSSIQDGDAVQGSATPLDDAEDLTASGTRSDDMEGEATSVPPSISVHQRNVFDTAYNNLTRVQKHRVEKRKNAVADSASDTDTSRGEGPSKPKDKGKGPHPTDWGLDMSDSEIEAQRAMLNSYADVTLDNLDVELDEDSDAGHQYKKATKKVVHHVDSDSGSDSESGRDVRRRRHNKDRRTKYKKDGKGKRPTKRRKVDKPSKDAISFVRGALGLGSKTSRREMPETISGRDSGSRLKLKPTEQIEKGNYINDAFNRVRKLSNKYQGKGDDPSSGDDSSDDDSSESSSDSSNDSSSSSSDEDEDGGYTSDSSSSSSSDGSGSGRRRRRSQKNNKGKNKKAKRGSKGKGKNKSRKRSRSPKPVSSKHVVNPEPYDGTASLSAIHKFMTESSMMVEDMRLPPERQVYRTARFLKGKAYRFYAREVAANVDQWRLDDFFLALFNNSFPVDFKERQRSRLERFEQRQLTVREYLAEMHEMFLATGTTLERERCRYFYRGLRHEIQVRLREQGISPESSPFDTIIRRAERAELASQLAEADRAGHSGRDRNNRDRDDRRRDRRQDRSDNPGPSSGSGRRDRDNRRRDNGRGPTARAPEPRRHNGAQGNTRALSNYRPRDNRNNNGRDSRKLSKEEREAYKQQGKCFVCGETNHMARNCPRNNAVAGSSRPGISSYSVGISLNQAEDMRALAETTEDVHNLSLNMLGGLDLLVESTSDLESDSDNEVEPRALIERLGDPVRDRLESLLRAHFTPLDGGADDFDLLCDAIHVYRVIDGYCIMGSDEDEDVVLPFELAFNPSVDVVRWYARRCAELRGESRISKWLARGLPSYSRRESLLGAPLNERIETLLEKSGPYPGEHLRRTKGLCGRRFRVLNIREDPKTYTIFDSGLAFMVDVQLDSLVPQFDLVNLFKKRLRYHYQKLEDILLMKGDIDDGLWWLEHQPSAHETQLLERIHAYEVDWHMKNNLYLREDEGVMILFEVNGEAVPFGTFPGIQVPLEHDGMHELHLHSQVVSPEVYRALERNSAIRRDASRSVPDPLAVVVHIGGKPVRALIDTGSLGDFMSTNLADQLKVRKIELATPINVQLAVQGSRTRSNYGTKVHFQYQGVDEERYFDIINLQSYDLILGTPFLYQHQVTVGFNPSRVIIGATKALPMNGRDVKVLASRAMSTFQDQLEGVRRELMEHAQPICGNALESGLPPLRKINHRIPLIDPSKRYHWRASRCPEPLRPQWVEKRNAYVKSGRWVPATAYNAVPMLCIPKPGKAGAPPKLRVVVDLRERNANTKKLTCPLPDMEGILRRVAKAKYRSIMDGKDAYEQIRIEPEDVQYSAMTTPDGPMLSNVLQQGDCNAVATFQTIMTSLFAPWLGKFVDVYLDDIIIYSDSLEDHRNHVKMVIDVLKREVFFLNKDKIHLLCSEMKILGRIIDDKGIRMDPDKVDSLQAWKTPTNRELLRGFLGAASYLADDIAEVRIPMGILFSLTSDKVPFRWDFTHQRAFDEVKSLARKCKDHRRVPLNYSADAPPINVVTDACATGIAGVVSQGEDWRTSKVAAFFSAKLNKAQQNYPVHELEMLAGVETMLRHRDILQGASFRWYTDHKGLVHLLKQRDLSGRQARWLEKMSTFHFEIIYVPGVDNILSDALSRIYSYDAPGTVRSPSEYTEHDVVDNHSLSLQSVSMPLLVGKEGAMACMPEHFVSLNNVGRRSARLAAQAEAAAVVETKSTIPAVPKRSRVRPRKRVAPAAKVVVDFPKRRPGRPKKVVAPAESGRPETGMEFAKRMARHFVLKGPKAPEERREGGMGDVVEDNVESNPQPTQVPTQKPRNEIAPISGLADGPDTDTAGTAVPNLLELVQDSTNGVSVVDMVRGRYGEDQFFKLILEDPKHYKNFTVDRGLVYLNTEEKHCLCIPKVTYDGRSVRELVINEAHTTVAHLGLRKTLAYLRDHVWWKDMVNEVEIFCKSCVTCMRTKPSNQKPYGLLSTLQPPSRPWDSIGMDFVGPLPTSENRNGEFDMLTVIIDRLTGMVHLVPSRENFTSRNMAELVFDEVYKRHGLPRSIVSDRDKLFTATFWEHLHSLIGTKLRMSSAYHPETDGVTERANRTVTQMIRQCIGTKQRDWAVKLPAVEFAINAARSETTGYAPFFLNYGRMPRSFIWDAPGKDEFPGVRAFATKMRNAVMAAHDSIIEARVKQTRMANRKRQLSPFVAGDLVYVSSQNIRFEKGLARKFLPKYIGPYRIIQDFGNNSYRLDLPKRMITRGVHNVFHASLLRVHHRNDDQLFPGRADNQIWDYPEEAQETEFAVERIVGHQGSGSDAYFHLLWKDGEKSWLPYHQVSHLTPLAEYLELMGAKDISELAPGSERMTGVDEQIELGKLHIAATDEGINIGLGALMYADPAMQNDWQSGAWHPTLPSRDPNNPILDPEIVNLEWLGGDKFLLTWHEVDGSQMRAVYYGGQIKGFLEISDTIANQLWQGVSPSVEILGGYVDFMEKFNANATTFTLPRPTKNGRWDVGRHLVTRKQIDIDRLGLVAADPMLEMMGLTQNGVSNMNGMREFWSRQTRILDSQVDVIANMTRLVNAHLPAAAPTAPAPSTSTPASPPSQNGSALGYQQRQRIKDWQLRRKAAESGVKVKGPKLSGSNKKREGTPRFGNITKVFKHPGKPRDRKPVIEDTTDAGPQTSDSESSDDEARHGKEKPAVPVVKDLPAAVSKAAGALSDLQIKGHGKPSASTATVIKDLSFKKKKEGAGKKKDPKAKEGSKSSAEAASGEQGPDVIPNHRVITGPDGKPADDSTATGIDQDVEMQDEPTAPPAPSTST